MHCLYGHVQGNTISSVLYKAPSLGLFCNKHMFVGTLAGIPHTPLGDLRQCCPIASAARVSPVG